MKGNFSELLDIYSAGEITARCIAENPVVLRCGCSFKRLTNRRNQSSRNRVRVTMRDAKTKSASSKGTAISDAEMAAVLANSNWARMEREAMNVATIEEAREENCHQDLCSMDGESAA